MVLLRHGAWTQGSRVAPGAVSAAEPLGRRTAAASSTPAPPGELGLFFWASQPRSVIYMGGSAIHSRGRLTDWPTHGAREARRSGPAASPWALRALSRASSPSPGTCHPPAGSSSDLGRTAAPGSSCELRKPRFWALLAQRAYRRLTIRSPFCCSSHGFLFGSPFSCCCSFSLSSSSPNPGGCGGEITGSRRGWLDGVT